MTFLFTEPKVEDQENGTKECIPEEKRPELDTSVDNLTPEPMEIQNDTTEMWYGHIKPRLRVLTLKHSRAGSHIRLQEICQVLLLVTYWRTCDSTAEEVSYELTQHGISITYSTVYRLWECKSQGQTYSTCSLGYLESLFARTCLTSREKWMIAQFR